jgi:hypothetical protein
MSRIDPVNSHRGPGLWTVDLFHAFFYRKIIRLNQKIPGAPVFLQKKYPKLFQNYILVHVFLHLGP